MPVREDEDSNDNGCKLKAAKEDLVRRQIPHQTLCGLSQPEACPKIDSQRSDHQSDQEPRIDLGRGFSSVDQHPG